MGWTKNSNYHIVREPRVEFTLKGKPIVIWKEYYFNSSEAAETAFQLIQEEAMKNAK